MLGRRTDAVTDVIESRRTALEELCQRHGVARLALFCSALRDVFDPDTSDLYLVEFSPMSPSEHAGTYFGLLEELENLCAQG
jgi:predicted nucleotidyltransferase